MKFFLFFLFFNSFLFAQEVKIDTIQITKSKAVYIGFYTKIRTFSVSTPDGYLRAEIDENDNQIFVIQQIKTFPSNVQDFSLMLSTEDNKRYIFLVQLKEDINKLYYQYNNSADIARTSHMSSSPSETPPTQQGTKSEVKIVSSTTPEVFSASPYSQKNNTISTDFQQIFNDMGLAKTNIRFANSATFGISVSIDKIYTRNNLMVFDFVIVNRSAIDYPFHRIVASAGYKKTKKQSVQDKVYIPSAYSDQDFSVKAKSKKNIVVIFEKITMNKEEVIKFVFSEKDGKRDIFFDVPAMVVNQASDL